MPAGPAAGPAGHHPGVHVYDRSKYEGLTGYDADERTQLDGDDGACLRIDNDKWLDDSDCDNDNRFTAKA